MTKKSFARQARDAQGAPSMLAQRRVQREQLKNNTCWDDLQATHAQCYALLQGHVTHAQLANNPDLMAMIPKEEHGTLATLIRTLAGDLGTMNRELNEIAAQHAGKTGGSNDPDEVTMTIAIFQNYTFWMEKHGAVLMPTVQHMLEIFDKAERRIQIANDAAAQAEADAQAGIVDVSVKDVVSTSAAAA